MNKTCILSAWGPLFSSEYSFPNYELFKKMIQLESFPNHFVLCLYVSKKRSMVMRHFSGFCLTWECIFYGTFLILIAVLNLRWNNFSTTIDFSSFLSFKVNPSYTWKTKYIALSSGVAGHLWTTTNQLDRIVFASIITVRNSSSNSRIFKLISSSETFLLHSD